MKPITILAATDFSEIAGRALERAAMIAGLIGNGRLELVNVVNVRFLTVLRRLLAREAGRVETLLNEEAAGALRRTAEDLSSRYSIDVASSVSVGKPSDQIVFRASELDAALVTIGHHGVESARELFLGSTARGVIRKAQRHVLVVKQPVRGSYRSVLAATDFSECSLLALKTARAIAPDAMYSVLHAFEAPFEGKLQHAGLSEQAIARCRSEAKLEADGLARLFCDRANIEGVCTIAHGHPTSVVLEHAERIASDLIAIGKHGQSLVEELVVGSVSEHVLSNARCDVLVAAPAGSLRVR